MLLIDSLRQQINALAMQPSAYVVAYSGGLDSHVLLHALAQLRQTEFLPLQAVHIHHGLSPHADDWVAHCQTICASLQVELHCDYLKNSPAPAESVEAWARNGRYSVFAKLLPPSAVLMTAHTQDDQAETVLLQLIRGAGPKGMAACAPQQNFAAGILFRPLLNFSRKQLHEYATQHGLRWLEDESNADLRFDRNFLRHRLIPLLRERWPSVSKNISRSATHCAEASHNLNELAQLDSGFTTEGNLSIEVLRGLTPARQRNLLRYWLNSLGCRMPNTHHIQQIQQQLINGRMDSQAQVRWDAWIIRRYHQSLQVELVTPLIKITQHFPWDLTTPLALPDSLGHLCASQRCRGGLSLQIDTRRLSIRFRNGGERCRLAGKNHSTTLKKLFQQWRIPAWRRDRVPLLYHEETIVSVIGYGICEPFAAAAGEPGWCIELHEPRRASSCL